MKFLSKEDIKNSIILLVATLFVTLPYFFYSLKQALIAVLFLIIIASLNKKLFFLISLYSIITNAFFLHLVTKWGRDSLMSRIQVSFESASYEQWEYFNTYFNGTDIAMLVAYMAGSLFAIIYILNRNTNSLITKVIISVVSLLLILSVFVNDPIDETIEEFQIFHLPISIYKTNKNLNIINQREEFIRNTAPIKRNCPNPHDKIVYIQGESVNRGHLGLYGYGRDTTPFLGSINSVYKFDAIASANQTRFAVPISLTDTTVENFDAFYKTKSLVSLLSECGYTTYWISNQGKRGEHETTISSIANEADQTFFLNDLDYNTAGLDENVLPILDSIKNENKTKQAFFIHLLGSHFSYEKRYPETKAYFKNDDLVSNYDNSIRYTDYIISEIFNRFNNEKSLFIYSPDHGEVLEVGGGHGYSPSYKEEYDVPLIFWSKKDTKLKNLLQLVNNKTINTESIFNIMQYLVGQKDEPFVSYKQKVISLSPDNIVDYSALKTAK